MKAKTYSITIACDPKKVFNFVAKPENLSQWATGFCRKIARDAQHWIVDSPQGKIRMRYVADEKTGVVDFYMSPAPGVEGVATSRVIPNGKEAEYLFTMFQAPDMSDELFEKEGQVLQEELANLKSILEGRTSQKIHSSCEIK